MNNTQKKLGKNKKPRVHISYDVETYGASKTVSLAYVKGVMGNFSGDTVLDPERKYEFVTMTKDSYDSYLQKQKATIVYSIQDENGKGISVSLNPKKMDDLSPDYVVENVDELKKLKQEISILDRIMTMTSNSGKFSDLIHLVIQTDNISAFEEVILKTQKQIEES